MEINDEIVDKLARLSKLEFADSEMSSIKTDLQNMLQFVNKLKELNTVGIEPLLHITDNINQLREDISDGTFSKSAALKNAAVKSEDFFLVPKVIKK